MDIKTSQPNPTAAAKTVPIAEDLHFLLKLRAARERITIRQLAERILRPAMDAAPQD